LIACCRHADIQGGPSPRLKPTLGGFVGHARAQQPVADGCATGLIDALGSQPLKAGKTIRGWVTFELPKTLKTGSVLFGEDGEWTFKVP
jgi:hypothetical protein